MDRQPRGVPHFRRRLRTLLVRHRAFGVAFAVAAALRATAVLGFRPALWFYGDSFTYVGAALRPQPSVIRPVGYSLLLWALRPLHSLGLVTVCQHLMGLAMAALLYLLLRRFGLPGWGATLATLPVLYDAYEIELEHLVMSDTVFGLLMTAATVLALWWRRPSAWTGLAVGLLMGAASVTRTVGLPLIVVAAGYFVIRRVGRRVAVAAVAGCAVPVLAYAAWFHSWHGQYATSTSTGAFLWARVASFADCGRIHPPPAERRLCLSDPALRRLAPGTVLWKHDAPLQRLPGGPFTPRNSRLARDFAVRAVVAQPGDYLATLARDLRLTFGWRRVAYPSAFTAGLYRFPAHPVPVPHAGGRLSSAVTDTWTYEQGDPTTRPVAPYAGFLRAYQDHVYLPGTLLGVILLVGLAGLVVRRRDRGGPALLPWALAVGLLLLPLLTADFDYRYVLPAVPVACLAAALAFAPRRPPAGPSRPAAPPGTTAATTEPVPAGLSDRAHPAP